MCSIKDVVGETDITDGTVTINGDIYITSVCPIGTLYHEFTHVLDLEKKPPSKNKIRAAK